MKRAMNDCDEHDQRQATRQAVRDEFVYMPRQPDEESFWVWLVTRAITLVITLIFIYLYALSIADTFFS
jgi:hypothetical protein